MSLWAARRIVESQQDFAFPRYTNSSGCSANSASAAINKWLKPRVPGGCVVHSSGIVSAICLRVECPSDHRCHRRLGHRRRGPEIWQRLWSRGQSQMDESNWLQPLAVPNPADPSLGCDAFSTQMPEKCPAFVSRDEFSNVEIQPTVQYCALILWRLSADYHGREDDRNPCKNKMACP